ncbi:MAG: VOC family protein [Calditrichia bacterium]
MSSSTNNGDILWTDLTVENAEELVRFYKEVIGWETGTVSMGDYNDYTMHRSSDGKPVAGICHKRGINSEIPPVWMVYITVENVDSAAEKVTQLGGEVLLPPTNMGENAKFCVIKDPAGAICALYSKTN